METSDLENCYSIYQLLKDLEEKSSQRNEVYRLYRKEAQKYQHYVVACLSIVSVFLIFGYFLVFTRLSEILVMKRELEIAAICLIVIIALGRIYMLIYKTLNILWNRAIFKQLKKVTEKKLRVKLEEEVNLIDIKVEFIISEINFKGKIIPRYLLSSEMLTIIIRYLELRKGSTIKEVINDLEAKLMSIGEYEGLIPSVTLLQKEERYLQIKKMIN